MATAGRGTHHHRNIHGEFADPCPEAASLSTGSQFDTALKLDGVNQIGR
jgi:hypothetical protein